MTRLRSLLLLFAGGALGAIATVVLVGSAHAQTPTPAPPPPMERRQWPPALAGAHYQYHCETKWEYRYWSDGVQAQINARGKDGWRWMGPLSIANPDVFCFERAF